MMIRVAHTVALSVKGRLLFNGSVRRTQLQSVSDVDYFRPSEEPLDARKHLRGVIAEIDELMVHFVHLA